MSARSRATAVLGEACGTTGLIGGQVMDLESEGQRIAALDLEGLHRAKTGALLSACVVGGAILVMILVFRREGPRALLLRNRPAVRTGLILAGLAAGFYSVYTLIGVASGLISYSHSFDELGGLIAGRPFSSRRVLVGWVLTFCETPVPILATK